MSTLLSSTLLLKKKILNEADEGSKYGLTDAVLNGTEEDNEETATPVSEEPAEEISAEDTAAPDGNQEDPGVEDATPVDDPTSPIDESDPANAPEDGTEEEEDLNDPFSSEELDGDGDMSMEDIDAEAKDTPGLRILTSISDTQYRLCNSELFAKFRNLASEIDDIVNNVVMTFGPENDREEQVINIVHDNLISMISDLNNYMCYTYGDSYEANTVAYVTFLKRYKIAMNIIEALRQERKDKNENKE